MANGATRKSSLPHGRIPFHHLADANVREVVMKLNENIAELDRRLAAVEKKGKE